MVIVIILAFVIVGSVVAHIKDLEGQLVSMRLANSQLIREKEGLVRDLNGVKRENEELTRNVEALTSENTTLRKSLTEAPLGFPSLLEAIRQYDFRRDKSLEYWLDTKSHPAFTAAQAVKTETQKRRDAEYESRKAKLLLDHYFSICPNAAELARTVESLREDRNRMLILLQQVNDELKSSNSTLAEKKRENEELTRTVEALKEENITLRGDLGAQLVYMRLANSQLTSEKEGLVRDLDGVKSENEELTRTVEALTSENTTLRKSLTEAPLGFPSLLEAIRQYDFRRDKSLEYWLDTKSHPAFTAAQAVKTETQKRRDAEYESRKAKLLLDYYFSISPDAQEHSEASSDTASTPIEAPSLDNNEDIAGRYLSREEYLMLSTTERNQLALDRFWNGKKSKQVIGRLYEQYVGYRYELNGWIVEYFGISEGFSDLGRDLICHRDNTTLIIQCKNWSKSKRIYEKHIFQLLGTTHEYFMNHQFEDIRGVFYTSTQLSDLARSFAKEFRIELHEGFELQRFPMIKCNIGREGEKIYHLPFDQQYYSTRINPHDGDTYCTTVAEAEAMGFRRAYRWHGDKQDY